MNSRPVLTHHVMQAVAKPASGKGAARAIRAQGMVPGIIYGKGDTAGQTIGINGMDLAKALRIGHFFTHTQELNLGTETIKVLARDIQRHPVTDLPIHVDFMRYDPARIVNVNVTVRITGQEASPGLKMGGVLQLIEAQLEVTCRADSIPQELVADVSGLGIGDSVHMSAITLPAGVKNAVTDRDLTVVSVVSTRTSKMEEESTAAAAAAVPANAQKADGKTPAAPAAKGGKDAKAAAPAKDAPKAPAKKK